MTETQKKLINDPEFLIEGVILTHPAHFRRKEPTGRIVVAVGGPCTGNVGIAEGSGSGHEPAYAVYGARGLADVARLGKIFASRS